ncbi:MAG: retention module-containing protein, partial [Gammaproteobacteria bacterium]|nr:retention module-containing protein [Gammaproteobacteria bacterium]
MADTNTVPTRGAAIGEVQAVSGRVVAISASGDERQLVVGDLVYADELIRTIGQGTVVIALNNGTRFDLGRDAEALLDDSVYAADVAALRAAALAEAAELQAAIAAGADPTEIADDPAAGGDPASAGESVQEGVSVDRTGRVGLVEAGFETSGLERDVDPLLTDPIAFGDAADDTAAGSPFVPPTPVVSILVTSVAGDNVVNAGEAGSLAVPVTGVVGGDAVDGDSVVLLVNGNTYTGVVSGGAFTIDVAGADLVADTTVEASITVTNGFGISATATDSSITHTVSVGAPNAPIVTITEDLNNDGLISGTELAGDIDVEVGLPAGAVAGDTITVSDGTTTTNIVLTPADISNGNVTTTFPSPGEGGTIDVTATLTDQAGNTSPSASDSATVDTLATPAPTVTITEDLNNDGLISNAELNGDIDVEVGLPAGAVAGDTTTVSDGTTTTNIVLTPADIIAGNVTTTFPS